MLLLGCTTEFQTNNNNADDAPLDATLIEGYIISIKNNEILVVENLSKEEADTSRYTENQILEKADPNATWVSIDSPLNVKDYKVGDRIKVMIDGGIDTSFPAQALAKEIDILN
ncbi:YobA family protein [Saccharibacillus sacchari]|uniref:YobA family protein n=1 Tax=Saccharibacillus sacchari TaxID=456493 RepID=UPI000559DB50|nr:YobA family protein [Saccharibacillus sacchari]